MELKHLTLSFDEYHGKFQFIFKFLIESFKIGVQASILTEKNCIITRSKILRENLQVIKLINCIS